MDNKIHYNILKKGNEEVERILSLTGAYDLSKELSDSAKDISFENKKILYIHMNNLFLNVMLNRFHEVGETGEKKAMESRKIICNIITNLNALNEYLKI